MGYFELAVGLLFVLALLDLSVGVSNDAVNFLNSSIGSRVAPRHVIMIIASLGMLAAARSHVRLPQVQAYVEQLPIADASFDALTMGYALRHVADLVGTFREYLRVLRPGGRVLIIEFAKPTNPLASDPVIVSERKDIDPLKFAAT